MIHFTVAAGADYTITIDYDDVAGQIVSISTTTAIALLISGTVNGVQYSQAYAPGQYVFTLPNPIPASLGISRGGGQTLISSLPYELSVAPQ